MLSETWEKAWDATPAEQRRKVQRWDPLPVEDPPKRRWASRLTGSRNMCPSCGDFFSGSKSFDAHRVGPWGKDGVPSKRRCLSLAEMVKKGFKRDDKFFLTMHDSGDSDNAED